MTKEEAIKRFETLLLHVDTDCVMGMETTEAINMAIKALEQPEPCEDAVSRKAVQYLLAHFVDEDKYVDACDGLKQLPSVAPKQPDCAKCKSELANKIRGQQDNPGMLTENDKGRNWGLEWAAQIVEGKRR